MSVPYVIERGPNDQERVYDLYSRILKDRIIFIRGAFNSEMANAIVAQLLFLESDSPTKDIYMYINSPGGEISSLYSIFDTMNYIKNDIVTIGIGTVASAGSFVLAAGTKGKRYALPNTEIMLHQLSSGLSGKYDDMKNNFKHTEHLHNKMMKHYVEFTGQKLNKIKKDLERDFFMTSEEAKNYGIIDEVQYKRG
jgi:ATP-dependent Clp protease protease subunit